jgi:hypothetical protein
MDSTAVYTITGGRSGPAAKGEGNISITGDAVLLRPSTGAARSFPFRDVRAIESSDYRLVLSITDGTRLELSSLGHRYEDVVREVHRARNELVMKDLLMGESLRKQGVKGELRPFRGAEGTCEVRLYDTALIIMPLRHPLLQVRFSDIEGIEAADHQLRIALSSGEQLTLAMLGRELDPLWQGIADGMAELEEATQAAIKDAYPAVDQETLTAASRLLKEGRAARRQDIEAIAPELWKGLEAKVGAMGLAEEYGHLMTLGRKDMARIGIKRSLSSEEGEYIWFMAPILGTNGNAVAMEATSAGDTGRATYFFRVAPPGAYSKLNEDQQWEEAERCMDVLAYGLREVNFRRQPIYLRDEQLQQPAYSRYRFSVLLIPELRDLRARFIGRVAHTSKEEWTAKIGDLLAFNSKAKDDGAKWSAGEELADPE